MIYGIPKFKVGHIHFALKPEDLSLVIGHRDIPTDMVLRIYDALFLNEDPELNPVHHKERIHQSGFIQHHYYSNEMILQFSRGRDDKELLYVQIANEDEKLILDEANDIILFESMIKMHPTQVEVFKTMLKIASAGLR